MANEVSNEFVLLQIYVPCM